MVTELESKLNWRENEEERIRRRDIINSFYRFHNIEKANSTREFSKVSNLYYFWDEAITDALYRKVMDFNEACSVVVYSSFVPLGSGKSNNTLQMATDLDPDFDIEENLFFDAKSFVEELKKVKKGQALIWDEAGVGGGHAREWRSETNKKLTEVMRLVRMKQPFVFFVAPSPSLLDLNVRVLCGIELDCFGVNQKERKSWAVCRALRWEQDEWGRWFKRESLPKQIQEDHRLIDVMAVQFSDMRRDEKKAKIWKRYEERKVEFLENMQSEENEEDKEGDEKMNKRDKRTKDSRDNAIISLYQDGWAVPEIAVLFKLSEMQVYRIIKKITN
ncbi:MAG: helix-turn-helix domain-containing protein [Candidatus Thermoplasmatota archaeon]|nr:helix-turn-helix domain-containing protein [Candidatus Thermoplasmatota archaeon]